MKALTAGFASALGVVAVVVPLLSWSTPSLAQTAPAMDEQALRECTRIQNALKRLVCFDAAMEGRELPAVAQEVPATNRGQQQAATVRNNPPERSENDPNSSENFGKTVAPVDRIERLDVVILERKRDGLGRWVIEFDNGQVWRQKTAESYVFSDNAQYFIERGAFSAFFLGRSDSNSRTAVERID